MPYLEQTQLQSSGGVSVNGPILLSLTPKGFNRLAMVFGAASVGSFSTPLGPPAYTQVNLTQMWFRQLTNMATENVSFPFAGPGIEATIMALFGTTGLPPVFTTRGSGSTANHSITLAPFTPNPGEAIIIHLQNFSNAGVFTAPVPWTVTDNLGQLYKVVGNSSSIDLGAANGGQSVVFICEQPANLSTTITYNVGGPPPPINNVGLNHYAVSVTNLAPAVVGNFLAAGMG